MYDYRYESDLHRALSLFLTVSIGNCLFFKFGISQQAEYYNNQ